MPPPTGSADEIFRITREELARRAGRAVSDNETVQRDLGLSSLDLVEVMLSIETRSGVGIRKDVSLREMCDVRSFCVAVASNALGKWQSQTAPDAALQTSISRAERRRRR